MPIHSIYFFNVDIDEDLNYVLPSFVT